MKFGSIKSISHQRCSEGTTRGVLLEKVFLEISQNSKENTCARVSFFLAQVFSCEFCQISKKTFFTEHLRTTASLDRQMWTFLKN